MSKYMLVLVCSVIFPLILSFYPPLRFWRNLKTLLLVLSILVVVFGGWDVFATWRAHWYFNPEGVSGARLINLPIEEWLFFIVIPFCCIFTWEALKFIKEKRK
ncbi:MAG: lycopene cyclase domain-containing protein [Candidatus Omnitrophica bacterium]|jgi:lycopene cyclase domain-containing protein|nr:lycopene cyclase domain-containing protein [Candidatus Omnitrophota bacterium]MDD5661253.1 lycopene cyclase domain-containing protein [Candidatus Omnitrophota bacterium]